MDTAILLAAGKSDRFFPFNATRNKTAAPIMNKPAIRRLAEEMLESGFTRLVVVVGEHEGSVRAALRDLPAPIAFVRQGAPHGTATAVLNAAPLIGEQPVLVAYGDVVFQPGNAARFRQTFLESGALAAALTQPMEGFHDPRDWIGARVKEGTIQAFEGHSTDNNHRLGGIFCFQPEVFRTLSAHPGLMTSVPVGGMPPIESDLAQTLQMLVEDGREVLAVPVEGFLVDLDKPWHLWEANARWLNYESERLERDQVANDAQIDDSAEIEGKVVVESGAQIGKRVVIKGNAFIGKETRVINGAILNGFCAIGARSRISDYCMVSGGTVVGNGCIVGHDAEMEGVMLDGSFLYHYCEVMGVVGQKVDLGAATVCGTLRFDDDETLHKVNGRREKPEFGANGTYFGDFSRTGVNVITMPGVKIGSYSCIGAGVVVYEDIPDRKLVLLKQELIVKDWGPERYGW